MKITLYKYILNEIWPTFLACLFVSVFIILATTMLSITDMIIDKGIPISQVIKMVIYLVPDILAFSLPAASLIAVVLAFLRLSADSEIIALKSCGISLYQMMPPVVLLSFTGLVITCMVSFIGIPWGNISFNSLIYQIAETTTDLGIKERVFSEPIDGIMFYVNHYSEKEKEMTNVFVSDKRDPDITHTIIAEKGKVVFHTKEKIITLRFRNGTMFFVGKDLQAGRTVKFTTYELNIDLKEIIAGLAKRKKKPKELSAGELISELDTVPKGKEKYNEIMIILMEKFTAPLAVFLMGIIGVPLGAQFKSRGRSLGVGISLAVFAIYYLCLAGVRAVSETGALPPAIGLWIPNLFLFLACIYLFRRVGKEQAINLMPGFLRARRKIATL
jgi:lipopolysaccharide export system permease protein